MSNYNIVSKSTQDVTFIKGDVKTLSLEEIDVKLQGCEEVLSADFSEDTNKVRECEDNLAAVVAEIDTKVSEREAELQAQVESDLAFAKDTLSAELQAAYDKYEASVKSIKDKAEETAKDLCEYKEKGLSVANDELENARKVLNSKLELKEQAALDKEHLIELKSVILAEQEKKRLEAEIAKASTSVSSANQQPQVIYTAQSAPVQNKLKF